MYEEIVSANLNSMPIKLFFATNRPDISSRITALLFMSILTIAILPSAVVAAMYKQIDKDGNVSYTDIPDKANIKPIKPAPIMTFSAPTSTNENMERSRKRNGSNDDGESENNIKQSTATTYQTLMINSPQAGAAVRANGGSISIQVTPEPALDTKNNHRLVLILDGQTKAQGQSTAVTVAGVERGAHTLSARIESADGDILINASEVTFHVLRVNTQRAN